MVVDVIRGYDLDVYVPEDPGGVGRCDALIVDKAGLDLLRQALPHGGLPSHYVVSDEFTLYRSILSILGVERVEVMQVGVDVGVRLAYVVLCDRVLLKAGYSRSFRELLSLVRALEASLEPARVVIKVGGRSTLPGPHLRALKSVPPSYELYVVDEMNSSTRSPTSLRGLRKVRFTRDIHAALNIVFREGVRVHLA